METIKRFISVNILLLFSILYSQSYTVSVLGYTIANIEITTKNSSEKRFELQSRGVADLLFPAKNNYLTNYDSSTFFLEKYNYDINQLDFDIVYDAQTDSSYNLIYNKKDLLRSVPVYSSEKISKINFLLSLVTSFNYMIWGDA